jgi:hypothetical protein
MGKSQNRSKLSKVSQFPRSSIVPKQSPKYWVKEKDRYLRQLLISDIESETGRPLIVYFAQLDQEINHTDPDDLAEILSGIAADEIDIFVQTPGGNVDAAEKMISVIKQKTKSYNVIVPSWAKSAGTVLALSSKQIILGLNSELGPIDPQYRTAAGVIPCEILASDPQQPYHIQQIAGLAVQRNRQLARQLLKSGMMKSSTDSDIDGAIAKISSTSGYLSHGAVIDFPEASALGLNVLYLSPDTDLWRRIWLLYCMYEYDTKLHSYGKIIEGVSYSISRPRV